MAAVATITLNDAQATPAAHNFIPLGPDQLGAWWFEDQGSGSQTIGFNRISLQLVRPKNPRPGENSGERMNRLKIGIHTPKLETLATNDSGLVPPPTVAYIPRATLELMLPERAILQDRKDLRKYAQFLLADAQVIAMAESLQNVF